MWKNSWLRVDLPKGFPFVKHSIIDEDSKITYRPWSPACTNLVVAYTTCTDFVVAVLIGTNFLGGWLRSASRTSSTIIRCNTWSDFTDFAQEACILLSKSKGSMG